MLRVVFIAGWSDHQALNMHFIVTFMWFASYVIWQVNVGTGIWVVLSNAIFGVDKTQTWSILGLDSVKTLGILGIIWISFCHICLNKRDG